MALEDIGKGDDSLLCMTNFTACCQEHEFGECFFPNEAQVPSNGSQLNMYKTSGHMVVRLNRRRSGEEGIYRCEIPDLKNVNQNIYIGVYSAGSGGWYMYTQLFCH